MRGGRHLVTWCPGSKAGEEERLLQLQVPPLCPRRAGGPWAPRADGEVRPRGVRGEAARLRLDGERPGTHGPRARRRADGRTSGTWRVLYVQPDIPAPWEDRRSQRRPQRR